LDAAPVLVDFIPDMPMFVVEDIDLDLKAVSLATVDNQKEVVTDKKYAAVLRRVLSMRVMIREGK
jgi:hypothetical protein